MTDVCVVLVTTPEEETAARISKSLLDEGLVACVNIVRGVRSLYRWKRELCDDAEVLMIMKSHAARLEELVDRVVELHPYETPEVLSLPVTAGAAGYLSWVRDETQRGEAS